MFESNEIQQVTVDGFKYIKKRLLSDINLEMCNSKKAYVDYLYTCSIPVARILEYKINNGNIIEKQEYIESTELEYSLHDYVSLIAKYHSVSKQYPNTLIQKNILKNAVEIEKINIEQTLIGFDEKYYTYARKVFLEKCHDNRIREIVMQLHDSVYKEFLNTASKDSCIIHNDLTSNNVVMNNQLYLIDFDFAINSSIYVDLTDILFPRNLEIMDYLLVMKDNIYIKLNVDYYNSINLSEKVNVHGVKLMAALKLFTFIMYIYCRKNSLSNELCEYLQKIGKEAIEC